MSRKCVDTKFMPTRLPLWNLATLWLLLDRFAAPQWAFGAYWTLAALVAIAYAVDQFTSDRCEPEWKKK